MPSETDAVVADVEAAYAAAYSEADPERLGALFAEDATVQTEWGPVLRDRSEIMRGLVALFASDKAPKALTNSPVLSCHVADDVIVSHGTASRRLGKGPSEEFLYTRGYVRRGATWGRRSEPDRSAQRTPQTRRHRREAGVSIARAT